jgi:ubiquinone/menaquinone biosynthesis C-methylase UbiE
MNSASPTGRDFWDRHAAHYDLSVRFVERPMRRMFDLIGTDLAGAREVLEVAAGTGLVTARIAAIAGHVTATDYSLPMVKELQRRVATLGLQNVECLQRNVYELGFSPASFDAVVCANVLHLLPDLAGALEAMRTVLRPQGKLIAPTFCHAQTVVSRTVARLLALTGFPGQRRLTLAALCDALEANGLRVVARELVPGIIPIGYAVARLEPAVAGK